MICSFCGTENPESAVFCKHCGKQLSGLLSCPVCGEQSPADGDFCIHCGTRLAPLPAAQPAARSGPSEKDAGCAQRANTSPKPWKAILTYISGAGALIAALAAAIFVFCMRTTVTGDLSELVSGLDMRQFECDLYYYFSDAYRDIEEILSQVQNYSGFAETSLYVPAVFGTIVAACSIVAVPALFIFTLVRYLRNLSGATEKTATALGIWTYAVFVLCAVLFQAVNAIYVDAVSYVTSIAEIRIGAGTAMNATTVAGIAVGGVGVGIAVVCSAVCRGKRNANASSVLGYIFSAAGAIFLSVIISLASGGLSQIAMEDFDISMTLSLGFMQALSFAGGMDLGSQGDYSDILSAECGQIMAFSIVGFVALTALTVFAALALASCLNSLQSGKFRRGRTLAYTAGATACAVLATVCAALLGQQISVLLNENGSYYAQEATASFTPAIVMTVLCAISLIVFIVYTALPAAKEKRQA